MPQTPPYLNSNEAKGQDANCLLSEDFEESGVANSPNGHWYGENVDDTQAGGGPDVRTKGWWGSIWSEPITPAGAAVSGAGIGGGFCGSHGELVGAEGERNQAEHNFSESVNEFYVRFYQKWLTGYTFGAEKVLSVNKTSGGGIWWGNLHINVGAGAPSTIGTLYWQPAGVTGGDNRTIVTLTRGDWWCIEMYIKKSTTRSSADGILRVWADNCGTDGLTHGASPTLQLEETGMNFGQADAQGGSNADQFGSLWWENWANPGSTGTSYIDQIIVSKATVGFFGGGGLENPGRYKPAPFRMTGLMR